MKYLRIDVHKKMCQVAVLDDEGELLDETRFMNTPEGIEEFASNLFAYGDEVKAVVSLRGTYGSRSTTGWRAMAST